MGAGLFSELFVFLDRSGKHAKRRSVYQSIERSGFTICNKKSIQVTKWALVNGEKNVWLIEKNNGNC